MSLDNDKRWTLKAVGWCLGLIILVGFSPTGAIAYVLSLWVFFL